MEHGTAVIAHATYDNIDLVSDVCRAGMFNKSWQEHKAADIGFRINHDPKQVPGIVEEVFENKSHGFTKVKFGKHTLGKDTLEMVDMGIIKDASFGFIATRANKIEVKGKKVRELKEVYHAETTLVHGQIAINPQSGVLLVKKSGEGILLELKSHLDTLEKFCRNANASDECIQKIELEVKAIQELISQLDTDNATHDDAPASSEEGNANESDQLAYIHLLNSKISMS